VIRGSSRVVRLLETEYNFEKRRQQMNMKKIMALACMALAVGLMGGRAEAAFDQTGWSRCMPITYTNDVRLNTLTNFPALVVLDTNKVDYSQFQANGQDLRFVDANGDELAYEVESWNTTSNSSIWVKVPTMTAGGTITAYWGNDSAPLPSYTTNGATWSESYLGVWHMASTSLADSTSNNLSGTMTGISNTGGVAGTGQYFDDGDQIVIPNAARFSGNMTQILWFKGTYSSGGDEGAMLIDRRTGAGGNVVVLKSSNDAIFLQGGFNGTSSRTGLNDGNWHQIALTFPGSSATGRLYVDGVQSLQATAAVTWPAQQFELGKSHDSYWKRFIGTMDEFQISAGFRSSNWIWATYANVAQQSSFVTLGAVSSIATFSIGLTSPANNQIFNSTAPFSATANVFFATPPCTVKFYLDGNPTPVSTTIDAPATVTVDLGALANGPHTVEARATDSTSTTVSSGIRPFTVDATPPTLAGSGIVDDKGGGPAERNTLVTYTVTFSKDMDASTVSAASFGNAGTAAVTIGTVTETTSNSGVFTVPVAATGAGTLQLMVNAGAVLNDAVGNALDTTPAILDDTTITVNDTIPPTLVSIVDNKSGGTIVPNTLVSYTVTFSEAMAAGTVDASDFGNAGTAAVTIGTVSQISPAVFSVQATPTSGGSLRLRVNESAGLTDLAGIALNTTSAILDDTTITVDATPPTLTSIVDNRSGRSALTNTLVTYTVTFSEDMDAGTVSASDFGNAGTAAVTIGTVTETTSTSGVFTVPVTATGAGTLQLKVNAGAVLNDAMGNALATTPAILDDTTITVVVPPGNFGSGGVITYTDASGLNPVDFPPYAGGYVVHTFTSSGTLNIPVPASADVLVVAGGGGGGAVYSGGGGAGGLIYSNAFPVAANSSYTVTVGSGGAGSVSYYNVPPATSGSNSTFGALIALGGGRGGVDGVGPSSGGSGGGGGGGSATNGAAATQPSSGSGGFGNSGGKGGYPLNFGGGGGGAGSAGGNGPGGNGLQYSISGTASWYAGGGGGWGALGGSGIGGSGVSANGTAGAINTGSGGGGANGGNGGAGGSGIVIVRYAYAGPSGTVISFF
jgi:hypothetical protein